MGGDEIDRGPGFTAAVIEDVARSAEPRSDHARRRLAAPEVAHRVAELVVPLGPSRREGPDLIAAGTAIPRLGDQLDRTQLRVLATRLQETALIVEAARIACQNSAEIEAEAVDVGFGGPVAQAVGDHFDHPHVV